MPDVLLPRLKVFARADDTLDARHREGAWERVDDGWWRDIALDPRARTSLEVSFDEDSPLAHYRLDRQRGDELMICCACGLGRVVNKAELIAQMGAGANVQWLAREVIDCGNRDKVTNSCQAYCVR